MNGDGEGANKDGGRDEEQEGRKSDEQGGRMQRTGGTRRKMGYIGGRHGEEGTERHAPHLSIRIPRWWSRAARPAEGT
jgi:hypothetical protein